MSHKAWRVTKDYNIWNIKEKIVETCYMKLKKGSNDIKVKETWYKTCFWRNGNMKKLIDSCKKHDRNIFFKTIGISKLRNPQNMTSNMIEIETLLFETMLGSCLCIVLFQIVLNHHLLEQAGAHCPYCGDISYNWWDILHSKPWVCKASYKTFET